MINLKELQKTIIQNKINKGFNTTDVNMEFCLCYGELGEAYQAFINEEGNVGEELADVLIYLLGLAEILNINLEEELIKKINKNEKRKYVVEKGKYIKIEG